MHGLSLLIFTLLVFGLLGWFVVRDVPVHCKCADSVTVSGTRGGLEAIPQRCKALCASHGGAPAAAR